MKTVKSIFVFIFFVGKVYGGFQVAQPEALLKLSVFNASGNVREHVIADNGKTDLYTIKRQQSKDIELLARMQKYDQDRHSQKKITTVQVESGIAQGFSGALVIRGKKASYNIVFVPGVGSNKFSSLAYLMETFPKANILSIDTGRDGIGGIFEFADDLFTKYTQGAQRVLAAVSWMRQQSPLPTILYGHSLGSALSVKAVYDAQQAGVSPMVDGLCLSGCFSGVKSVLGRHSSAIFGSMIASVVDSMTSAVHIYAGIKELKPRRLMERIKGIPLLMHHEIGDDVIAYREGLRVFNAATHCPRCLVVGTKGEHSSRLETPYQFRKRFKQFFKKHRVIPGSCDFDHKIVE